MTNLVEKRLIEAFHPAVHGQRCGWDHSGEKITFNVVYKIDSYVNALIRLSLRLSKSIGQVSVRGFESPGIETD